MAPQRWKLGDVLHAVLMGVVLVPVLSQAGTIVSARELADLVGNPAVKVVDVRSPEEYRAGHVPGAIPLHVQRLLAQEEGFPEALAPVKTLEALLGSLGISDTDLVVLYGEVIGVRTARAYWVFDVLSHPRLRVLHAGISGWRMAGHPLSAGPPAWTPTTYVARPDWTKVADAAYVLVHLRNPDVVVVDSRSYQEWTGEERSQGVKRPGRIPGARHVDWISTLKVMCALDLSACLREVGDLYRSVGVTEDKEIITYSRVGRRAAYSYLILKLLGFPRVRVYDRSLIEWGNRPDLPMEVGRANAR